MASVNSSGGVEEQFEISPPVSAAVLTLLLTNGLVAHILAIIGTRRANAIRPEDSRQKVPSFLLNSLLRVDMIAVIFFLVRGFFSPVKAIVDSWEWCYFAVSTSIFFTWSSGLANVLMCAERSFSLMAPFLHREHVTLRKAKFILAGMLVFAGIVSILPFFGLGLYAKDTPKGPDCVSPGDLTVTDINKYHLHFTVIFFFVGFSIILCILACNVIIIYYIFHLKNKIAHLNVAPPTTSGEPKGNNSHAAPSSARRKSKSEMRFALIMIFVSIAYMISWLPLYCERLLLVFSISTPPVFKSLGIWIHTFNYVIDPVIFVFLKKRNRAALKLVCAGCCCCCCKDYKRKLNEEIRLLSVFGATATDNTAPG